jgi:hypothetical protein
MNQRDHGKRRIRRDGTRAEQRHRQQAEHDECAEPRARRTLAAHDQRRDQQDARKNRNEQREYSGAAHRVSPY